MQRLGIAMALGANLGTVCDQRFDHSWSIRGRCYMQGSVAGIDVMPDPFETERPGVLPGRALRKARPRQFRRGGEQPRKAGVVTGDDRTHQLHQR